MEDYDPSTEARIDAMMDGSGLSRHEAEARLGLVSPSFGSESRRSLGSVGVARSRTQPVETSGREVERRLSNKFREENPSRPDQAEINARGRALVEEEKRKRQAD